MNLFAKAESGAPKTQAELLFAAQQRKERHFRANVALTWGILLFLLVLLFSGPINIDTTFIKNNMLFIAGGVGETIRISILSIILATILALLAALGRLSTFPPIYALSTFYVSLIRGTPLYWQIMVFFLALPQLDIRLPGLWAGVIAIGRNYADHAKEQAADVPTRPMVFTKNPASACLNGDAIEIPAICRDAATGGDQTDFEGEFAVILGNAASSGWLAGWRGPIKDVPEARALECVVGYTIAKDVSARWWQKEGSGGQFCRGKSFDTFCPWARVWRAPARSRTRRRCGW